ncbi:hypothetical protein CALVIDRAFT_531118 [Calocera viscosa TUFC12733]|uniref:Uncharacterized protein n=1 Tax=Calocera viscosa (strain TUFC12733) TaxID=1330018 RepID=A0A167GYH7_CALVF|nr:hypothetical protein CALVIDRAFT_531118 [Calocera viscosa TUFC12733]
MSKDVAGVITAENEAREPSILHSDLEHDSEPEDGQGRTSAIRNRDNQRVIHEENIGAADEDTTANHGEVDPRISDPAQAPAQANATFFDAANIMSRDEPVWPFSPHWLNAEYDDKESGCEWLRCTRVEIDLYDDEHPATYPPDEWEESVRWAQPRVFIDCMGALSTEPNWDAAIPPAITTTLDDTWLSIYPQQYTRKLRDKHAFIGFPWEHHYYHIGECQNRQYSLSAFRESTAIHLDLPQLKELNQTWIESYEDWADRCPWKAEDQYFSKYQPFLVILKYGQNAEINLRDEGWTELASVWDRKYDMARISRFTVALAIVQEATNDWSEPVGVVADANRVLNHFKNANGTTRELKMFPLAFTKTACNIQSKTLPNFLAEEVQKINNEFASDAGVAAGQQTVVSGASYQLYACPKIKLRPTAATRTDLRLGRMTAALVGCGLGGTRFNTVSKLIRRIERKSPFERTADRLLNGNTLIGARSEPEFVLFPNQLPAASRNARGIIKVLKRFLALYWQKAADVRSVLLVFRPGVWPKLMLSSAFMFNLAAQRIWADAMKQSLNGRFAVAWQLIEAMSICERNMILAQSGNQIIMDRRVYGASGMLERYRETGFPSTTEEFWPCDHESNALMIDSSRWPQPRDGAKLALLGWWAASKNWGEAAANVR